MTGYIQIDLIQLWLFGVGTLIVIAIAATIIWFRMNYKIKRRQWKRVGDEWYDADDVGAAK